MGIYLPLDVMMLIGPHYEKYWTVNQFALILRAIFDEEYPTKNRIETFFCKRTLEMVLNEKVLVDALQALFLANQDIAYDLLIATNERLADSKTSSAMELGALHPIAIVSLLKTVLFFSKGFAYRSEAFEKEIPHSLGAMIRVLTALPDLKSPSERWSSWLFGQLTENLSAYIPQPNLPLDTQHLTSTGTRVRGILKGLGTPQEVGGKEGKRLLSEVNHRLFSALGPVIQIDTLQKAELTG